MNLFSGFNCNPHILADRLKNTHNMEAGVICWLMDLWGRNGWGGMAFFQMYFSPPLNTPRALPLLLFYTICFFTTLLNLLFVIVSLLSNGDSKHGPIARNFMDWCKSSFLNINAVKRDVHWFCLISFDLMDLNRRPLSFLFAPLLLFHTYFKLHTHYSQEAM